MIYSNENKGFTVRDILIQLLIIILFVFLLVWLFPTKASFKGFNKKIDILTSTIYGTNIQTMKEAAVSYYTNERLPQAINDVERLTLKDMLNLHLLVDFIDGNGNSCSKTDSYVEVIKLQDEYQMKINLSCTDNDAYIIVHLGCYDYCNGLGLCAKKEEITVTPNVNISCSYEYEKVLNGKWGDYGVWSEWSTTKVTEADYRQVETKNEVVLIGKKQVQVGTKTETVDAKKTETKYCSEGFTLVNNKCTAKTTKTIDATCRSGYTLNSNGTCSGVETASIDPTCPAGYSRNGINCTKTTTSNLTADPYCSNSSYERNGGSCYGPTSPVTYSKGSYIGTYTGSSVPATTSTYYYESVSSDYVYSCETSCAFRWVYTYKKYNTIVSGGNRDVVSAVCPSGYSLSGSTCIKPTSKTDTVKASCPTGTLNASNNRCEYRESRTINSTCPTGYTQNGSKCTTDSTSTVDPSISISYSCDSGYTLNGSSCTRVVPVYEEQDVYENITYYRYRTRTYISGNRLVKWSNSQNDASLLTDGYSLTGNRKCSK